MGKTIDPRAIPPLTEYRESDGRPMGETPLHRDNLMDLIRMLRLWYVGNSQVYISGNMFLYYVPGDRTRSVVPDVFVALGVPRLPERRVYKTWVEGKGPDFVVELTSRSTKDEDRDEKFAIYRDQLKVPEYFLFDPEEDYLEPPLQGFRLVEGRYEPIVEIDGRLPSQVLGLHLVGIEENLRLWNPADGLLIPHPDEVQEELELRRRREVEARLRAEEERRREAEARRAAEAEVERLRAELERLRSTRGDQEAP